MQTATYYFENLSNYKKLETTTEGIGYCNKIYETGLDGPDNQTPCIHTPKGMWFYGCKLYKMCKKYFYREISEKETKEK